MRDNFGVLFLEVDINLYHPVPDVV
jgi:hypothetical protein